MKIVLTHISPDFDAVASAYAAYKLYECDAILTCTSYESNVNEYLKDEGSFVPLERLSDKEIDSFDSIELLVITDCKLKKRLGRLSPLVEKAEKIIVYDHHLITDSDIDADEAYIQEIGSTMSIILPKLKEKNIEILPEEAGLFMLGIYEDTGMLSFSSTTPADLRAVSYLLELGADVTLVGEHVKREMSREQVFVLNELLMNLNLIDIYGVTVAVASASTEHYVGEISFLAHRIMDIENLDALFVLVRTGERIVLIGRSRINEVNAVSIIQPFGGGGHPSAASANVKSLTLHEAFEKLKVTVKEHVRPVKVAREIMNFPVKTVKADETFKDAMDRFMKYNLNIMPVLDVNEVPVGIISRKDILSGIKHGFSDEPVMNIMQIEFDPIEPEMPYYMVEDIMINNNRKMVMVTDEGKLLGVITRTDLIRIMYDEISKMPRFTKKGLDYKNDSGRKNIGKLVHENLTKEVTAHLKNIAEFADEQGVKCYLVGGVVRDIIMKNPNDDIDIVVVGDAPKFAVDFAKKHNARVSVHIKFRTAVVIFDNDFRIDFATSRTEYYNNPAAAPVVEGASIRNDLYRRDFSINSMAVQLTLEGFGTLLDFYGGQRDIVDKKIRVLHSLSFVDDPSRAYRAIRFAVRFGFDIGPQTDKLLKHAVSHGLFDRIVGARMYLELKYILSLEDVVPALDMMKKYDLLKFYSPKINMDGMMLERFETLDRLYGWYNVQFEDEKIDIYKSRFVILFHNMNPVDLARLSKKLDMNKKVREDLIRGFFMARNTAGELKNTDNVSPSYLYSVFKDMDHEYLLAMVTILGEDYLNYVKDYLVEYQDVELDINGKDFIDMGYTPSGLFGKILKAVLDAKIDGIVDSKEEQIEFAVKLFEENI